MTQKPTDVIIPNRPKMPKPKKPKLKLVIWISQLFSYLYPMAKRWTHQFHGGVFPKYNKELSNSHPLKTGYIPSKLTLPLQQHVGFGTEPLVQVGDWVQKNQRIADTDKGLSAPIHAPTSGQIIAIENCVIPHVSGITAPCIVIAPDFNNTTLENALGVSGDWPNNPETLKDIVHKAGIVGMGGAGFPTFAKFPKQKDQIHTLLINGAECEPFITCDDVLMQTKADEIVQGALIVAKALGSTKVICGIENNKPQAVQAMKKAAKGSIVTIQKVPTVYPMGGQKQLTQELTGIEIPAHSHAVDIGILMMNVATYAAIYQAVTFGNPLTSRYVTVSGLGFEKPYNIDTLLGTSFEDLANQAQPKVPLDYPLIMGGPMMGVKMPNNQVPIVKTTNCVLANPPEPVEDALPCIRCGECMDACPINLLPQQMYWFARAEDYKQVEELNIADCIECGCCSFVCPSHIPLVQYYRHAKAEIKLLKVEEKATELAKQRHEAKLARIERELIEREARLKAKKDAVKQQAAERAAAETNEASQPALTSNEPAEKPKPAAGAAAAAARAAAARKKSASQADATPEASDGPMSARDKAIETARKQTLAGNAAEKAEANNETVGEQSPADKRKAAMEAAKQKALAKKQAATSDEPQQPAITTESDLSPADKRKAAMEVAKKQAAESGLPEQEAPSIEEEVVPKNSSETTAASVEPSPVDKRKAAMEAAQKRALAKKQAAESVLPEQEAPSIEEEIAPKTSSEITAASIELSPADKRKAAMEAAQKRAAERKAAQLVTSKTSMPEES